MESTWIFLGQWRVLLEQISMVSSLRKQNKALNSAPRTDQQDSVILRVRAGIIEVLNFLCKSLADLE